ncbi:MAG TPA: hypothetical protein VGK22_04970 [Candidatus Angelobacter sp.]|jgi:hypothetical protein
MLWGIQQAQHIPAFEENLTATVLRHLAITWGTFALDLATFVLNFCATQEIEQETPISKSLCFKNIVL